MIHPLINKNSAHYDAGGKTAIEELEEMLTLREMIGFCKGNIKKYSYRADHKGQKSDDLKKIETYRNYLDFLYTLVGIYEDDASVKEVHDREKIKMEYKI
jgi:hypothetical protein